MSDTRVRTNSIITITPEALDTFKECMSIINQAHLWASDFQVAKDFSAEFDNYDKMEKEFARRKELATEMELSFLRNWAHLTCGSQSFDGSVTIWRDMKCGFFWRYEKSGYHGGFIFHRNHSVKDTDIIGTWSIHT